MEQRALVYFAHNVSAGKDELLIANQAWEGFWKEQTHLVIGGTGIRD